MKKNLISAIVIIILVVMSIGGYFWYQTSKLAPWPPIQNASWKTYTNTQYGFEIKYPQEWAFNNPSSDPNAFYVGWSGSPIDGLSRFYTKVSQKNGKILNEWMSENGYVFIKNVNINGTVGAITRPTRVFGTGNYYSAIFLNGDYVYEIFVHSDSSENPKVARDFLEQVLSTFKFIQ